MKFFRRKSQQPPAPPAPTDPAPTDAERSDTPPPDGGESRGDASAVGESAAGPAAPNESQPQPLPDGAPAPAGVESADPDAPPPPSPATPHGEPGGSAVCVVAAEQPEPAAPAADNPPEQEKPRGLFARLRQGLGRTSDNLVSGLGNLILGDKSIDDDLLEELETRLLMADVGVDATTRIIGKLTERVSRSELGDPQALLQALREELQAILEPCERPLDTTRGKPFVILVVGVNGVGKTTTIGKMAQRFQQQGQSVMLAAGDTFRAAAVEQLQVWGERNRVPVVAQHPGADPASVIFDALQAATAREVDVLIADTAGRLHTKINLMDELAKITRVMKKIDPEAPHEVMLVVDATTGQNALNQAVQFHQAVGLTGITLTKLDGTAKGGILFAIAERLGVPIRFVGVGETIEDLRPFDPDELIDALLSVDSGGA